MRDVRGEVSLDLQATLQGLGHPVQGAGQQRDLVPAGLGGAALRISARDGGRRGGSGPQPAGQPRADEPPEGRREGGSHARGLRPRQPQRGALGRQLGPGQRHREHLTLVEALRREHRRPVVPRHLVVRGGPVRHRGRQPFVVHRRAEPQHAAAVVESDRRVQPVQGLGPEAFAAVRRRRLVDDDPDHERHDDRDRRDGGRDPQAQRVPPAHARQRGRVRACLHRRLPFVRRSPGERPRLPLSLQVAAVRSPPGR